MKQPGTLEISTVEVCKNGCDYCPQHQLVRAYKRSDTKKAAKMSFNTFKICIDKLPYGAWVDFSAFVEPFLNERCADMILYAHNKGHPIRIFTTMVGMSKEDINKIKDIDFVRFSLHLPDNDGIMKAAVDDNYCEVFDYLLNHWKGGDAMCFGPLHSKLVPLVREHRLKVKMRGLDNNSLGTRANNVKNTKNVKLETYARKRGRIYCKPILQKNGGPYGRFNHNVLLPNGDVVLCCSDYALKHKLGNLLIDNYEDLFISDEYKKIMRGLEDESPGILCRTCEHAVIINYNGI